MHVARWTLRSDRGIGGTHGARPRRRVRVSWILVLGCLTLLGPTAGGATAATTVSLTFDDGRQDQYTARALLAAHGMHGTFYVNSGIVGSTTSSYRMTWSQLHDLEADGNEITGHSLTHAHLTQLSSADLQREVCQDRTNLLNQGFSPVASFAYPYGEFNSTVSAMVQQCGYSSARRVSGIRASDCSNCPFAELIPPLNPWAIRAPMDIKTTTTLETMKGYVTQAEQNGGGWVVLVIHNICNGCDPYSVTPAQLSDFLVWLEPRAASNGTVVKTVNDVISGVPAPPPTPRETIPPVSTISCAGAACASTYYKTPVSVALAATDNADGSGVKEIRYTTNGSDPTATSGTVYSGPFSVASTATVRYRAFDNAGNAEAVRSQLIRIDTTAPTTTIGCNGTSCSKSWYRSSVSVTLPAIDAGSGVASTRYTTDGTTPTSNNGATYTAGQPFSVGATTTVRFGSTDNAGNVEAVKSATIRIR